MLQSMELQRVGHDQTTKGITEIILLGIVELESVSLFCFLPNLGNAIIS